MTPRERFLCALNHKEPDRVPYDMGATVVTGIQLNAYARLRDYLGLPKKELVVDHLFQQLAKVDEDLVDLLEVDVRNVTAHLPKQPPEQITFSEDGEYKQFYDAFGVGWRMPVSDGMYYDMFYHPLAGDIRRQDIADYPLPDPTNSERFRGVRKSARRMVEEEQRGLVISNMSAGIFELFLFTRGYLDGYMDWAGNQPLAQSLIRRFVEMQMTYWEKMLNTLEGIPVDAVEMSDDLAGQFNMLISPDSYRAHLKPLHKEILEFIRSKTDAKIFFHSCGSIRPVIPDLIEIGVDILNPVQVNAEGMDSAELKREYGKDLVFWGGGVDTQQAFDYRHTPEEVREDVCRRLDDLMPGGGFIFSPVHNIQGDVPPENIMTMWKTMREFGVY